MNLQKGKGVTAFVAKWLFYSYPSCSTCRDAERWLSQEGIDYERVHIYNDPPDRATLQRLASLLPGGVADLISTRGRAYRELGLADKSLSPQEWLDMIEQHPRLLRRPIITDGQKVLVGYKQAEYEESVRS